MAINRAQIPALLLPGLAAIEGRYDQIPMQWPQVFSKASSQMAFERAAEMRYVGLAQLKSEGAATQMDNASGQRYITNIQMNGFGLGFAMSRESLDDNLYKDQFNPSAMGLVESFAQTKEIICADVLNSATTYNAAVVGDGVALCSTSHPIDGGVVANRPSTDLSLNESAIETGLNQVADFRSQNALKMFARGRKLVVPRNLGWTAERLTKTELRVGTANNDVSAIYTSGAIPEGYTIMDFLTSNYAWFLTTSVNSEGRGLVYYDRIPYEMNMEVDTSTQNLLVYGYERYGVGWRTWRGIWGSFPTA